MKSSAKSASKEHLKKVKAIGDKDKVAMKKRERKELLLGVGSIYVIVVVIAMLGSLVLHGTGL